MNQPDLGEQAISKAVEIGLESQLDEVEKLQVDIRANPIDLVGGEIESVTVDGKGIVMQKDLRAERLILQTDSIEIDSIKATFGNIELIENTNAKAKVVLLEKDIQRAFNSKYIVDKLKNQQLNIEEKIITVNASNVKFTLPGDDKIALTADIDIAESKETKQISLSAKPVLDADGNKIAIADVEYHNQTNKAFAQSLLDSAKEVLDLRNFELNDMSLRLDKLDICKGKIIIAASAIIENFPGA